MNTNNKGYQILLWVFLIFFTSGLLSTFLLASHVRLSGDDYCYNAVLENEGFWGMQIKSYFEIAMYHGNRYSLTFLAGLSGIFPVWGASILIISSIMAWIVGILLFLIWLSKKLNINLSKMKALVLSEGFVCIVLWGTPQIEQSILWRSSILPYFMPLVYGIWLLLSIFWAGENPEGKWLKFICVFFIALFAGGFSETGAALQGGFLGLLLIFSLIISKIYNVNLNKYFTGTIIAIFATALAIGLLYFSPVRVIRSGNLQNPLEFGELVSKLGWHIKIYFWEALMRRTFTVVFPLLFGFGLVIFFSRDFQFNKPQKIFNKLTAQFLWVSLILGVALLILIGCILLPATYIYGDYPPERALILSQAVLAAICIIEGGLIAFFVLSLIPEKDQKSGRLRFFTRALGGAMLISVLIVPLLLLNFTIGELAFYSKWSTYWDQRHQRLIVASKNNVDIIHVMQLDKIVPGVGELSSNPDYWYNNCAEMYYGVDAIIADQSGW